MSAQLRKHSRAAGAAVRRKVERLSADGTITRDSVLVSDEFVPCVLKQYVPMPIASAIGVRAVAALGRCRGPEYS